MSYLSRVMRSSTFVKFPQIPTPPSFHNKSNPSPKRSPRTINHPNIIWISKLVMNSMTMRKVTSPTNSRMFSRKKMRRRTMEEKEVNSFRIS